MKKDQHKTFRDLWSTYIWPLKPAEKLLNAFGHHYNAWQGILATLSDREKNRLDFFVAFAAIDAPINNYIDYIRHVGKFCEVCVRTPDSSLARTFDPQKIGKLKLQTDILIESMRGCTPAYLDRVRAEMPPPDLSEMQACVRSAEIQALKEDVLGPSRAP